MTTTQVLDQSTVKNESIEGLKSEAQSLIESIHLLTIPVLKERLDRAAVERPEFNDHFLTIHFKSIFMVRALETLNVSKHTFKSTQKRYRTELYINKTNPSDMHLMVSMMDSKDLNAMYARLYDVHSDLLVSLLFKLESSALPFDDFLFNPTFANQVSMEAMQA